MEFTPEEEGALSYEAVLITPRRDDSSPLPPLAVAPHGDYIITPIGWPCKAIGIASSSFFAGGPHVVLVADFFLWPTCLAALGFAVLMGESSLIPIPDVVLIPDCSWPRIALPCLLLFLASSLIESHNGIIVIN